jgi:3'-5' exoribonuclease 1
VSDRIELLPYDAGWPEEFKKEKEAVVAALGSAAEGLSIEHTGSTAVPGLKAKPTIDLMVGAPAGKISEAAVKALVGLGYKHMGEHGIPGREFFRKGLPPTHHLHWVERDGSFWERLLLFRDHLRTHPGDCVLYETVKSDLAGKFSKERERYTAGKDAVCAEILARARAMKGARLIVLDLEATCWEVGNSIEKQEIIEFGAIEVLPDFSSGRDISMFVKPVREPKLTDFCKKLTSITQEDVDGGVSFERALANFIEWIGPGPFELASWSDYDLRQLRVECERRKMPLPRSFEYHIDLRALEARRSGVAPSTMADAMKRAGLTFEGTQHRGVDDARNAARLLRLLMGAAKR